MKTIAPVFFFLLSLSFFSCSETKPVNEKKPPVSLTGKVYQTSDGMDSACHTIVRPTDYFLTILFINDSEFVQVQNTCCGGDDTTDFADAYYSKGTYALAEKTLTLDFPGEEIVHHVKGTIVPEADSALVFTERFEAENPGPINLRLERFDCGATPYFRLATSGSKDDYFSPPGDSTHDYRKEFEQSGAWKLLFPEKK